MITISNSPVLSIIVTAHNCEDYLEQCLNSLLTPAGEILSTSEIILVDDDSDDLSPEICRNFSQKYPNVTFYAVNFRNIGMVRNFALSQCTGQYITMIDGDDQVIPGALSDITTMLAEQRPDLLLTRLNEVYETTPFKGHWMGVVTYPLTRHEAIIKFLVHREVQAHFIGQFFRREILAGMKFPEFRCYEDAYLFPYALVRCTSILFCRNGPYLYLKRSNSLSVDINPEKISMLIDATEQMTIAFGQEYENLIACHWINIQHRYQSEISNKRDRIRVRENLSHISALAFLCDTKVRLSFKKKFLKLLFTDAF